MGKHSKPRSEEHKAAIAAAWTPELRAQHAAKFKGRVSPMLGRKHTEEAKEKISQWNKGESNPFFGKTHDAYSRALQGRLKKGIAPKLYKHGITDEEYAAQTASGNRWCHFHKGFSPASFINTTGVCQSCNAEYIRRQHLKNAYGVDADWYDAKLAEQGGGCAICGVHVTQKNKKYLAVDHCHRGTGTRGLLCYRCNLALERIECMSDWADKAHAYLDKYKA